MLVIAINRLERTYNKGTEIRKIADRYYCTSTLFYYNYIRLIVLSIMCILCGTYSLLRENEYLYTK